MLLELMEGGGSETRRVEAVTAADSTLQVKMGFLANILAMQSQLESGAWSVEHESVRSFRAH